MTTVPVRALWAAVIVLGTGCGGGDSDPDANTSGGQAGHAGHSPAPEAGAGVGMGASGASGGGSGGSGGSGGDGGGAAGGGADAGADAGSERVGVCGQRGNGTVTETEYDGVEEFYVIGEEGFGDEVCVVRLAATRAGDAPAGCDDPAAGIACSWTHLVEFGDPMVVADVDGACANSDLGLDDAAIAALEGTRAAYGFVSEFAGHNSVVMKYDEALGEWDAYGNGTWDEQAGTFRFDRRDGFCDY